MTSAAAPIPTPALAPVVKSADRGRIWVNRQWRPCTVLAVIADRALVEYVRTDPVRMRPSFTALAFIDAFHLWPKTGTTIGEPLFPRRRRPVGEPGNRFIRVSMRPCAYKQIVKPWLKAVCDQYGSWIGHSTAGQIPPPQALLADRFGARRS